MIWTVEYSLTEKSYHVDTLGKVLENNLMTIFRELKKDYLLIGLFRSHEDAHRFIDSHKHASNISDVMVTASGFLNF